MIVLAIGDIIGRPGRRVVAELLPALKKQYRPDLIMANAENAAGGFGLSLDTANELLDTGINVLTSGNHIWAQKDIIPYLDSEMPILRPLNYPPGVPGRGYIITKKAVVISLMGRTFMTDIDCPFRAMDTLLPTLDSKPVIVDFHAEATSEKMAMGHYLDGRVSAVLGTHTHVATADARVLPGGTAYISDMGMAGPVESIIGDDSRGVIQRFLTGIPVRLTVAKGRAMLNAVVIEIDDKSGWAVSIKSIREEEA
jgi:metallophosphoesterase (TIGR00282 family)